MLTLCCLTGCFDRRELDALGIVLGVAVDKSENAGEMAVTVQIAKVVNGGSKDQSGGGSSGGEAAFFNLKESGKNINYIIREMQHYIGRMIYVAHSKVLVFGEELARSGVRDAIDFFARAPEARMTLNVFVARGKGGDILDVKPKLEKTSSSKLQKMLTDQKITSHTPIVTELEFVTKMVSKTTSAVAPLVSIEENKGEEILKVSGCGVFKGSAMVGELNEDQTRGMLFVQNKVKQGVLRLVIMETPATIEIRKARTKVTPVLFTDGSSEFHVAVDVTVGLGDQTGTKNLADPDNTPEMLGAVEEAVRSEIEAAVHKAKELQADVFGFGEYLNRKYPDQWKKMQENWDELFNDIKVNITVKAKADGSGRIVRPLVPEGA